MNNALTLYTKKKAKNLPRLYLDFCQFYKMHEEDALPTEKGEKRLLL